MTYEDSLEKMQVVVNSLQENLDVTVVGGYEAFGLISGEWPERSLRLGRWEHELDIYAHPSIPIYDVSELNDFMLSLVPELTPDHIEHFEVKERFGGKDLEFGHLTYYDKDIGSIALSASVQLNKGSTLVRAGLEPEWQDKRTISLRQLTKLRVFPDGGHLANAAEGHDQFWVDVEELGKMGLGRVVPRLLESPTLKNAVRDDKHQLTLTPLL